MSKNGQIMRPGAVQVDVINRPGPLATPVTAVIPSPGQIKLLSAGGLTKVEHLAGQLAPALTKHYDMTDRECDVLLARHAVALARAILKEANQPSKPQE